MANDTTLGLSALVHRNSDERCVSIARQIDSGRVLINTLTHKPRAPFSGFKHSVPGREMERWGNEHVSVTQDFDCECTDGLSRSAYASRLLNLKACMIFLMHTCFCVSDKYIRVRPIAFYYRAFQIPVEAVRLA
nr:aldehyde dehydrogenase family protein [Pseudomonas sp. A29(2023)]